MKKAFAAVLCTMALGTLAACGGPDNEAACQKWVSAVKCGSVDISSSVNCSLYKNTSCDISGYFDCLSKYYVCNNGMYDTSKLSMAGQCASMAVCK